MILGRDDSFERILEEDLVDGKPSKDINKVNGMTICLVVDTSTWFVWCKGDWYEQE